MTDPTELLALCVCVALFAGAWLAIRECANAAISGNRNWYKRAIYLAQQRQEYKEFSRSLDETAELDRMVRDERG